MRTLEFYANSGNKVNSINVLLKSHFIKQYRNNAYV